MEIELMTMEDAIAYYPIEVDEVFQKGDSPERCFHYEKQLWRISDFNRTLAGRLYFDDFSIKDHGGHIELSPIYQFSLVGNIFYITSGNFAHGIVHLAGLGIIHSLLTPELHERSEAVYKLARIYARKRRCRLQS